MYQPYKTVWFWPVICVLLCPVAKMRCAVVECNSDNQSKRNPTGNVKFLEFLKTLVYACGNISQRGKTKLTQKMLQTFLWKLI